MTCLNPKCTAPAIDDLTAKYCGECGRPLPHWAIELAAALVAWRTLVAHASGDTKGHGMDVVNEAAATLGDISDHGLTIVIGPHVRCSLRAFVLSVYDMAKAVHCG